MKVNKLAICTFHSDVNLKNIGGVSFVPVYNTINLRKYFNVVDTVSVRTKVKSEDTELWKDMLSGGVDTLRDYDYVIFQSLGLTYEKYDEKDPEKYKKMLDDLDRPFSVVVNEENDRKIYPYHMDFITHPNCQYIIFNCPGMTSVFQDWIEIRPAQVFLPAPPLATEEDIINKVYNHTSRSDNPIIMSTSRWTTSKRILEFVRMKDDFERNGITLKTAGARQSHWYVLEMQEVMPNGEPDWEDLGYFEPHQLPGILKEVTFHWNFLFQKKGMGLRTHQPRLELVTLEALNEGCLPVICSQFTPDWVGTDSAVRLPREELLTIPDVLGRTSKSGITERVLRMHKLVQENIFDTYDSFASSLEY